MSQNPISEKSIEILFNRYFLQSFKLGELGLYAPTSVEEFERGYDSLFFGINNFRELYLQFKSPGYSEGKSRFTIRITPHQHRLLKEYPKFTAFYISHLFPSLKELNLVQSNVENSKHFLKYFICIEVSNLPPDLDFIQYFKPKSHRESPAIKYKIPGDGSTRTAKHPVTGDYWLRGNLLADKLKNDKIGSLLSLEEESAEEKNAYLNSQFAVEGLVVGKNSTSEKEWNYKNSSIFELCQNFSSGDFGIFMRKFSE